MDQLPHNPHIPSHEIAIPAQRVEMQSPAELGQAPYQLGAHETLALADFAPVDAHTETVQGPHNFAIEGKPSLDIRIGGNETFATVKIIDISDNPTIDNPNDPEYPLLRQAGLDDEKQPVSLGGNFVMVVMDQDGKAVDMAALIPGDTIMIGRGAGTEGQNVYGGDALPDTVSRDHMAIGLDEKGKLVIENHDPTNGTAIDKPEHLKDPSAQAKYERRALGSRDEMTFDGASEPLASAEETARTGLAGEVVGRVSIEHAVDALIVRQTTNEHGFGFSIAQKAEDGTLNVKTIRPGELLTLDGPNASVDISVDSDGKLHTKPVKQRVSGSVTVGARKQRALYKHGETEIRNKDERHPAPAPLG